MRRLTAVLLVLAVSGSLIASPYVARRHPPAIPPLYDADDAAGKRRIPCEPRGLLASEWMPLATPSLQERRWDQQNRPYHLRVRMFGFDTLAPFDIEVAQLDVTGASSIRKVGPGDFLCSHLSVGFTSVRVFESANIPVPLPNQPVIQRTTISERSPVFLGRHAVTTVDIVVLPPTSMEQTIDLTAVVYDRFTSAPIANVLVTSPDGSTWTTDENGRFTTETPIAVSHLMELAFDAPGFVPLGLSARALSKRWLETWRETGEAVITLRPLGPAPKLTAIPAPPTDGSTHER